MVSVWKIRSKMEEQDDQEKLQRHERPSMAVGLRILVVQISNGKSNIVVKSAIKPSKPPHNSNINDFCFLKTCCLCNIRLSHDKEVYMYRGDQGFCSIECRERQMSMDEVKELEASTKQMIASYRRNCLNNSRTSGSGRSSETKTLLQDMVSSRHKPTVPRQRNTPILTLS